MSTTATLPSTTTVLRVVTRRITADQLTPVSLYLALRDRFTDPVMLESNETRHNEHYFSIIGLDTVASYRVDDQTITRGRVGEPATERTVTDANTVSKDLGEFLRSFQIDYGEVTPLVRQFNGLIGHTNFEGAAYFDTLSFDRPLHLRSPALRYHLYRFVLVFHHYRDELLLLENLPEGKRVDSMK